MRSNGTEQNVKAKLSPVLPKCVNISIHIHVARLNPVLCWFVLIERGLTETNANIFCSIEAPRCHEIYYYL